MPYIKPGHRTQFDIEINEIAKHLFSYHELYEVCKVLIMKTIRPKRYRQMMEITGLLTNITQEFVRRYDQQKGQLFCKAIYDFRPEYGQNYPMEVDFEIHELAKNLREGCGDVYGNLNYCITSIIKKSFVDLECRISMIVSVIENLKYDFYQHIVAPYEDLKIEENGDL